MGCGGAAGGAGGEGGKGGGEGGEGGCGGVGGGADGGFAPQRMRARARAAFIAPPAPGIFEAKMFGVEGNARGTPGAIVGVVVQAPDSGTLRVDQT